jgi:uncharacterized membrane protein YdjX (TVP38/TMEM64 family)
MSPPETPPPDGRDRLARLLGRATAVGLVVAAGVVVLGRAMDATTWLTADGLRAAVGADAWYGPVGYVAAIVASMFSPLPKVVLLGLGGVLFGPWAGFLYAWMGQILGMTALFVLARSGLRDVARRLVHENVDVARRLDRRLADGGMRTVAMLRLLYFMGTPISVALATTRLRLRDFVLGTAIGVVPAVVLAVASGDAVASGAPALGAAAIGLGVVLVVGAGTLVRRRIGL